MVRVLVVIFVFWVACAKEVREVSEGLGFEQKLRVFREIEGKANAVEVEKYAPEEWREALRNFQEALSSHARGDRENAEFLLNLAITLASSAVSRAERIKSIEAKVEEIRMEYIEGELERWMPSRFRALEDYRKKIFKVAGAGDIASLRKLFEDYRRFAQSSIEFAQKLRRRYELCKGKVEGMSPDSPPAREISRSAKLVFELAVRSLREEKYQDFATLSALAIALAEAVELLDTEFERKLGEFESTLARISRDMLSVFSEWVDFAREQARDGRMSVAFAVLGAIGRVESFVAKLRAETFGREDAEHTRGEISDVLVEISGIKERIRGLSQRYSEDGDVVASEILKKVSAFLTDAENFLRGALASANGVILSAREVENDVLALYPELREVEVRNLSEKLLFSFVLIELSESVDEVRSFREPWLRSVVLAGFPSVAVRIRSRFGELEKL